VLLKDIKTNFARRSIPVMEPDEYRLVNVKTILQKNSSGSLERKPDLKKRSTHSPLPFGDHHETQVRFRETAPTVG
jgi:hypothetical protein